MRKLLFLFSILLFAYSCSDDDNETTPPVPYLVPWGVTCHVTDGALSNGDITVRSMSSTTYFFPANDKTYGAQQISDIKKGYAIDSSGNSVASVMISSREDLGKYFVFVIGYEYAQDVHKEIYCFKIIDITDSKVNKLYKIFHKETLSGEYEEWNFESDYDAQIKSLKK